MKTTKILFAVSLVLASLQSHSQGMYGDEYLERLCFPSSFSTCRSLYDSHSFFAYSARVFFPYVLNRGDTIAEIEQYYSCDSVARLSGIAYINNATARCDTLYSFRLRDANSDSIIVSIKPSVHTAYNNIYSCPSSIGEFLFDSVITVNGDFSFSIWFPNSFYEEGLNSPIWTRAGIMFAYYTQDLETNQITACNSRKVLMVRYSDGTRKPFLQMMYEIGQGFYLEQLNLVGEWFCDLLYMPIFAEPDTVVQDTTSSLINVGLEQYISLYPNPTKEMLNVFCSYKIKSYTIIDAMGREIISEVSNANSLSINVQGLKTGIYFIRLKTAKGLVKKKFVVE